MGVFCDALMCNFVPDIIPKNSMMKIAIPTFDGMRIANDLGLADAFLVLTIKAEVIVSEELRRNALNTYFVKGQGPLALIKDCSVLIVKKMDEAFCELVSENEMECIETEEVLITNAIIQYLEHEYREKANTCCSP